MVVLTPYAVYTNANHVIQAVQPEPLNSAWWSVFVTVSAFSNCGLNLLNQSMIRKWPMQESRRTWLISVESKAFANDHLILIFTGAAILAGGTLYPVFIRLMIWALRKCVTSRSELHHSLTFLLHHPRRCYLLLFPSTSTWILFAVQVAMNLLAWVFWIILGIDQPAIDPGLPARQRVMDGLYQAHGVRTSGLYIIDISKIAPGLQFLYLALMYASAYPFIMSLRQTNVYEERSLGLARMQSGTSEEDQPPRSTKIGVRCPSYTFRFA